MLTLLALLTLASGFFHESSEDTWAVIIGTSRYWYNYRHTSNPLNIYRALVARGIADSHIILGIAGDVTCGSANPMPGVILGDVNGTDVYGCDVEADFTGDAVNVETILQVLTGRQPSYTTPSKRLLSGPNSNVLIYLTGHGGDGFMSIQDWETLSSGDVAAAIRQMEKQKRYGKLLLVADTCQAASMSELIDSPNVAFMGSSLKGESSYSINDNSFVGAPLSDRFSAFTLQFLNNNATVESTLGNLTDYMSYNRISSTVKYKLVNYDEKNKPPLVTQFFAGHHQLRFIPEEVW